MFDVVKVGAPAVAGLPVVVIVAVRVVQVDAADRRVAKWREPPAGQVEYDQQIDDQRNER